MKKVGFVIIILAIICTIYSAVWWQKSNEFKQRIEKDIADLSNDPQMPATLQYDNMERAGYPFRVEYIFTNPQLNNKKSQDRISHQGHVTIGASVFNVDKVFVRTKGKTDIFALESKDHPHIILSGKTFFKCNGCVKLIKELNQNKNEMPAGELITDFLKDVTIKLKNFEVTEPSKDNSQQMSTLFKAKKVSFHIDNDVKNQIDYFNVKLFVKAMETNFIELNDPSDQIFEAHGELPAWNHPFIQNPTLESLPSFSVVIDKHKSSNEFGSGTLTGDLHVVHQNENIKGSIRVDSQVQFTEKYHEKMIEFANVMAKSLATDSKKTEEKELAALFQKQSRELVPDYAKFGPIAFKLDDKIEFNINPQTYEISNETIDLKELKLSADLYGAEFRGQWQTDGAYSGFLETLIYNHRQLFHDIVDYYNKWQKILAESNVTQLPVITNQMVDKTVLYLESLSAKKDPKLLDITITYQNDQMTIGNKPLTQVIAEYTLLMYQN